MVVLLCHGLERLAVLTACNGVAAIACLVLLHTLLGGGRRPRPGVVLAAASWGLMRFATDNEAYVLPLALSLAALACLRRSGGGMAGWHWAGGSLSALAISMHQLQLLWALPLALYAWRLGGLRAVVRFCTAHSLVLILYTAVWLAAGVRWASSCLGRVCYRRDTCRV